MAQAHSSSLDLFCHQDFLLLGVENKGQGSASVTKMDISPSLSVRHKSHKEMQWFSRKGHVSVNHPLAPSFK